MNTSSSTPSRFACPTSTLDPDSLLGQLRKTLWLSVGLAVLVHLAGSALTPLSKPRSKKRDRWLPSSSSANRD